MRILLTNDDGIDSPGLRAMFFALKKAGHEVMAVAPMRQQSGVSHCLTVFEPLRSQQIADGAFTGIGIHGTPADCARLALGDLMPEQPDMVVAGINQGRNVGPDLMYSGTVAAAAEGANAGIPSLALSHANHLGCAEIDKVAEHAVALLAKIDWKKIAPRRVVNVNYPEISLARARGIRVCPQSPAVWRNEYARRNDPRGLPYWWLTGDIDKSTLGADTDRQLLDEGYITVTPLKFEYTDMESLEILRGMAADF